jgi:cell division septum initiation protein DivIVA
VQVADEAKPRAEELNQRIEAKAHDITANADDFSRDVAEQYQQTARVSTLLACLFWQTRGCRAAVLTLHACTSKITCPPCLVTRTSKIDLAEESCNLLCEQNVAKHAEPAGEEVSQRIEGGARTFAANARPAAKEITDRAIDTAHDVSKHAKPTADRVSTSTLRNNKPC